LDGPLKKFHLTAAAGRLHTSTGGGQASQDAFMTSPRSSPRTSSPKAADFKVASISPHWIFHVVADQLQRNISRCKLKPGKSCLPGSSNTVVNVMHDLYFLRAITPEHLTEASISISSAVIRMACEQITD
jgi:hypothetical protein